MLSPILQAAFPDLDADGGAVTHPPDPAYNCVAWAAGVTDALWWPADPDGYWPPGAPDELTVAAFVAALASVGYAPCTDGGYEPGFEKAAVYARGGVPTHVARQLAGGRWSSKLGRDAGRGGGDGLRHGRRVPPAACRVIRVPRNPFHPANGRRQPAGRGGRCLDSPPAG